MTRQDIRKLTRYITLLFNRSQNRRGATRELIAVAIESTRAFLADELKQGNSDAVDAIWKSQETRKHYFSFATKFCSWHNQEAYAIYDQNMWEALRAYKSKELGFQFKDSECKDRTCFQAIVKRFEATYDLEAYSLKDVDEFLWLVGGQLLKAKQKKTS
jgi:hypothetical protein